jgi:hypothetical protein
MSADDPHAGSRPGDDDPVHSPSWLKTAFRTAAVPGAIALAGVALGGAISYEVQARQIGSQRDAAAEQDRAVARGTGRLMSVELRTDIGVLNGALGAKRHPRRDVDLTTFLSADDERVVASAMSSDGWAAVADAAAAIGRTSRLLDRHHGKRLTPAERMAAQTDRRIFSRAVTQLVTFDDHESG